MTDQFERFGADLRLLGDLDNQNDRSRGSDLYTAIRPQTGQVDLETLTGVDNLKQALFIRFLTPAGEMAILGHPSYGSRLYELIGERNVESTHNRAKMFVLQALAEEPRVKQVLSVTVTQNSVERTQMDINILLVAIDGAAPLNLVFPFFLQGGV